MKTPSLRARLLAGTLIWLVLGLVAGGAALSYAFRRAAESSFDERLEALQVAVVAALEAPRDAPLVTKRTLADPRFEQPYSGWYWQVSGAGEPLRSRSLWDETLAIDASPIPAGGTTIAPFTGPRGDALRVATRTITLPGHRGPVLVAVAGPAGEIADAVARFDRLLLLSLGGLALALALAVVVQVGYGLRPLQRLARDLDDVRAGRSARLATDQPAEIAPLAVAMNDVLDHDARLVERARTHVGNLAHGLKTPLSVLALEASRGVVPDADVVAEQVATMSRLVEHHLSRAAASGARRVLGARCPLAPVVGELRATLLRLHAARALVLDVTLAPDVAFAGEREDLEEMLGNLLDNACKWAASRVMLRAERTEGQLVITVEDDGPGVAVDDAEIALRRGGRLDEATPGSGLGLAIVADLAQLYDGTLALTPGAGGGLCARLTLPAA